MSDRDFLANILPTFSWVSYEIVVDRIYLRLIDESSLIVWLEPLPLRAFFYTDTRPTPVWAQDPGLSVEVVHGFHGRSASFSRRTKFYSISLWSLDVDPLIGDAIKYVDAWTRQVVQQVDVRAVDVRAERFIGTALSLGQIARGLGQTARGAF